MSTDYPAAGDALDALVARHTGETRSYSNDIKDAWYLVETLVANRFRFSLGGARRNEPWKALFAAEFDTFGASESGATAAEAIARAYLSVQDDRGQQDETP